MRRFRFPIAVAMTSLALVAVVAVAAALTLPIGIPFVQRAMASALGKGGPGFAPHGFGGPGFTLPPELQGLGDLPPAERFAHFVGGQVNLKDKDNRPLTVHVIPGTASAVGANSLVIAANDGTIKTFVLNDDTIIPGKPAQGGAQASQAGLHNGARVVVITLNDDPTARAVVKAGEHGFGPRGFGGPPPWFHRAGLPR